MSARRRRTARDIAVEDAHGIVDRDAAERALASLDYSLLSYRCSAAEFVAALTG